MRSLGRLVGSFSLSTQHSALSTLAAEVTNCRACEVAGYLEYANPIRPGLIDEPRMLLIGQAPGPVTDRNGDRQPSRAEIALCRHFLDREFDLLQPKVVLLVGKMAIDAFLGKRPLTDTVGRVFPSDGRVFVPLPHASGVSRWLNTPANKALLERALAELSRLRVDL